MSLCLTLRHEDLRCLVRGCTVPYEVMNHPLVKPHFIYCDHPQSQSWRGLKDLTEAQLWTLYLVCSPRTEEEK